MKAIQAPGITPKAEDQLFKAIQKIKYSDIIRQPEGFVRILLDIKKTEAGKQTAMFTIKPRIRASRSEAV